MQDTVARIKIDIQEQVENKLNETVGYLVKGSDTWGRTKHILKLNDQVKTLIEREVSIKAAAVILDAITEAINKSSFFDKDYIDRCVKAQMTKAFNVAVQEAVNAKMEQLKTVLGS